MNRWIPYKTGSIAISGELLLAFFALFFLGAIIAWFGIMSILLMLASGIFLLTVALILLKPRLGIIFSMVVSFIAIGLSRYIDAPTGLLLDAMLVITLGSMIFQFRKFPVRQGWNILTVFTLIWFTYTLLELFNPYLLSREAWFYAVRGVSLYNFILIPMAFVLFCTQRDLDLFFKLWFVFSVCAAMWAFKQLLFGLDSAEQNWLNDGGAITHVIHGQLRAFSFYSDAGQLGAAMGHAGLAASILGLSPVRGSKKALYFLVALVCFSAMVISGTRGALFVPLAGFLAFFVLIRNYRVLLAGLVLLALAVGFLKFTYIGQDNYHIRRMRTALDPENPSLVVRKENQKKIAVYLENKPFGAGVGSAGSWALRFAPESYLSSTPLDSWYVKIWAETGIVGLTLYLTLLFLMLYWCFPPVFNCPDPQLKYRLAALYSGVLGMAVASYGNQIMGQQPSNVVLALSLVFLFSVKSMAAEQNSSQSFR